MAKPTIVTRLGKGSELTFQEGDDNFTNLRDATVTVAGDSGTAQAIDLNGTITVAGGTGLTSATTTNTITVNLDNTAVTAGSYTKASVTIDAQGRVTAASNGSADFTQSDARTSISVTDAGGDGSLSYASSTGVITYTGPSAADVRAHFSGGTGITITDGAIATTITQYTDAAARGAVSATDAGGEGSFAYDNATGVFTYTGPSFSGLEVTSAKNQNNGYAGLDANGKVASAQLPSYVDDVVEAANFASLPAEGETSKIYVALDNGKIYRWSGSAYVEISASPGSTDAVTEGSTNLYFTTQRARDAFSASTGITLTNGAIATTITQYTDSLARSAISAGTGIGYDSGTGVISSTITQYADSNARAAISVTDAGGDGSASYNSSTGVITYTGPGSTDYRAAFSAGTGITITDGVVATTITQGITDVVNDTTPQLGGNLDVNGQSIVSASNGNITLAPNGTGRVVIDSLTYPKIDGTNGQVLTTNGTGSLTFTTVSSGVTNLDGLSDVLITGTPQMGQILRYTANNAFENVAAGYLSGVAGDSTPMLGGNLNVNGNSIVSSTDGNITLAPNGTGRVSLDGVLWPAADGTNGQVLSTNGSGSASWITPGGGGLSFAILQNNNTANYTSNHTDTTHPAAWTEIQDTNNIVTVSTHDFTVGAGTYSFSYIHNKNLRFSCQASGSQVTYPTFNWFFYDVTNNANRAQLDFDGMKDRGFTNGDFISQYLGPLSFNCILTVTGSTTYRMRTNFDVGGGTSSAAINLSGGNNSGRGQLTITKLA